MARGPKKKRRRKQPTVGQRNKAQAKRAEERLSKNTAGRSLSPQKPDVRIGKAQAAWEARRYDEAIWYYERALARNPNNAVLLVDVARAYGLRFRYAEAEKLVDRARALYPDDAHLQRMLGRSYVHLQQFDRAIACYHKALELEPAAPERAHTMQELAKMHERLHQLDAARDCAEEALAMAPNLTAARITLAIIDRREGDSEAAQSRLRKIVEDTQAPPNIIADAWYQLASIDDQAGHYDEAFDALTHAKKILDRASTPYREDVATVVRTGSRTFRTITPEHFRRWNTDRDNLKPLGGGLALLTSHPRSGTTLLEQLLDSHPGLISADEIPIMSDLVYIPLCQKSPIDTPVPDILDRAGQDELAQLRQDYWRTLQGALGEPVGDRILLDKNPAVTGLLPVVGRVFPNMKILFALRDPRDVVVSCFMQSLSLNLKSVHYLTLEDTVKEYARTMRMWLKYRAMIKNPWIEVRYEETVADMESQARKVLEFLELPWDETVLDYHRRAQRKYVRSPTYEAVTRPVYTSSIGRWRNYQKFLEPVLETLMPLVREFGYDS